MTGQPRRTAAFDWIKALAIFLVCLYHFPLIAPVSYEGSVSFGLAFGRFLRNAEAIGVPLFLMVNGALLLNRPYDAKKHLLRTVRLFVGMILWYILTMGLISLWRYGFGKTLSDLPALLNSVWYLYEYDGVRMDHLWFIQMLNAVYLIFPLFRAILAGEDRQLHLGIGFVIGGLMLFGMAPNDFAHLQSAVLFLRHIDLTGFQVLDPFRGRYSAMAVYFLLGGVMEKYRDRLSKIPKSLWAGLTLLGWLGLLAEWYVMTRRLDTVYDMVYNAYACLPTLIMACGVFGLLRYTDLPDAPLIRLAGRNTLAVYYLHWIAGCTVLNALTLPMCLPMNVLKAAVMVILCSLIGEGLRCVPGIRKLV